MEEKRREKQTDEDEEGSGRKQGKERRAEGPGINSEKKKREK